MSCSTRALRAGWKRRCAGCTEEAASGRGLGAGSGGEGGACRAQGAVMFSALTKKRMAEELEGFEQRSRPREQLGPDRIRPAAASTME